MAHRPYINLNHLSSASGAGDTPSSSRRLSISAPREWTDEFLPGADGSAVLLTPSRRRVYEPSDGNELALRRESAITVQRWYRRQIQKFSTFGPMIFTCKDGRISDFGRLSFSVGNRSSRHFVRVADTTSAAKLAHFLEKYWRLRRPDVLISVTGSAASLTLTSQLQRVFDRGLAAAAAMTNAWIFTGGTDSGVMKLVGEAMHKGGLVDVPVVGIAPWNAIHGKGRLEGVKGQEVYVGFTKSESKEGRLNPYHTHQILVDAGEGGGSTWGGEIGLRSRLERTYATAKGVPVVLLVVQGGPFTLDMMLASAELGEPLLILADSGGAATAIAQFCEGGIKEVEAAEFRKLESKLSALERLHTARGSTLLTFFSLADEDSQHNMASSILDALFRNLMWTADNQAGEAVHANAHTPNLQALSSKRGTPSDQLLFASAEVLKRYRDQMQRALLLCVKWNQPKFARRILMDLSPMHDHSRPIRKMLQQALAYRRIEIVRLLLERPGVEISATNLCELYLLEDPFNFFRSDASSATYHRLPQQQTQAATSSSGGGGAAAAARSAASSLSDLTWMPLRDRLNAHLSEIARDGASASFFKSSYKLYQKLVRPTLSLVAPHVAAIVDSSSVASHVDTFFWAVLMGDMALGRELWAHVDNPLHCALLAASLMRTLSKTISAGREEALEYANQIESWACGVLDEVAEQELAHWLLSQKVREWRLGSSINLAVQMELKTFLAHRHCQSLMDLRWRGGFPDSAVTLSAKHTYAQFFVWAFLLPMANPYLKGGGRGRTTQAAGERARWGGGGEGQDADDDHVGREALLLGALAEALQLRRQERAMALSDERSQEAERKAAEAAQRAEAKAEAKAVRMKTVYEERSQGGESTPAANDPSRLHDAVHAERKVGPSAIRAKLQSRGGSFKLSAGGKQQPSVSPPKSAPKSLQSMGGNAANYVGHGFGGMRAAAMPPRRKHGYYSVPLIKYLLRAATHVLFLLAYAEVLTHLLTVDQLREIHPVVPSLSGAEWVLIAWSVTLGFEHRRRESEMASFGMSTNQYGKGIVHTAYFILGAAILLRLVTLLPGAGGYQGWYTAYQILLSFDSVLMMCELFTFMWTSSNFGVLTITLAQMMVDLGLFVVFFSVVLIGFCLALIGLSETAPHEQHLLTSDDGPTGGSSTAAATSYSSGLRAHPGSTFSAADAIREDFSVQENEGHVHLGIAWQPFWAMYAEFDLSEFARVPFGLPLMWVYVLISNVVLVNMLIAMFADTYARIKGNAANEYRFQLFLNIFEFQYVVRTIPPPFNFPLLLWDWCRSVCASRETRRSLARMSFDDGYDEDPEYTAPLGMERHECVSVQRKFVQRYLKQSYEITSATSTLGLARRIERSVSDMEERMQSELEHISHTLTAGGGSRLDQRLAHISRTLDRLARGKASDSSAVLVSTGKEKLRSERAGASPPPARGGGGAGYATCKSGPASKRS